MNDSPGNSKGSLWSLKGPAFAKAFGNWVKEEGWSSEYKRQPDTIHHRFFAQAACLLINKLFYKLLENTMPHTVPAVDMVDLADPAARRNAFNKLNECH